GRPVEAVLGDGASEENTFAEQARRLIVEEGAVTLFGCWSSASRKRVAQVCAEHDRLLFYPAAYEGLEQSPFVVYLGATPNQGILPVARYASRDLGKQRFFLVGSEWVYSHVTNAILADELKAQKV